MRGAQGVGGASDQERESPRRSREPRGGCGARPAPRGARAGTLGSEALAHLGPEPARPLTSSPGCSSVLSGAVLPAPSRPPRATALGPRCQGSAGAGAEAPARISASAEPNRTERASPPSSLLRLCRRSGPGALRLRTFHSSFHALSAGQPLIGSARPDVNTSLPRRPRPSPFPG